MRRRGGGGGRAGGGGVVEMCDHMGIVDKFRGGDRRQTIAAAEMQYNGDIGEGDTGIWRWRQRQRPKTGDRRDDVDAA